MLYLTRRAVLGHSAAAAASVASPIVLGKSRAAAYLSAFEEPPPEKVGFKVGDSLIVGNLYRPSNYRAAVLYPAVVVGGSLSSVKEMMAGTYAGELSKRGVMALAIDYRNYGESGGKARQYEQPDLKAEDLSAAAAYLASRQDVRPEGVGLLGICTSGGNVLYAAARDRKIRAVAAVASHFAEPSIIASFPVYGGTEAIARHRAEGRTARAKYEAKGENTLIRCYHSTDRTAAHIGPMEYYMDPSRGGGVSQWKNSFAVMSWEPWLDFDPVSQAKIVVAPTLIVHSDGCALPEQAKKVHSLLMGPKEIHWTTGNHFEFYDGPQKVREAADVVADYFRKHLA